MTATKSISVSVPTNLTLDQSKLVLENVLKRTGCPTCFSGLKIGFESEVERLTVNPTTHEVS